MSGLVRSITAGVLALGMGASVLAAQEKPRGSGDFRWYLGAQGGVYNFETTAQTRGWLPTAGLHTLIIARRTGLLLQADEVIGTSEVGAYSDSLAPTGARTVVFNDIRRASFALMAFPWRSPIEPYFGVGGGLAWTINPQPQGTAGLTPAELDAVLSETDDRSSFGYALAIAGAQLRAGPVMVFGQVQATTAAPRGSIYKGATFLGQGGIRISLGKAREDQEGTMVGH
jgi:hypothetical protein